MKVDVCFSPVLYPFYADNNDTIVVVVDIFRATTTMCTALNNGASGIIPVATVDEARSYKDKGYLVGGERNVVKFEFGDFGNTPSEYTRDRVQDRDIVISTTNGTQAIDAAEGCYCLVIGSFLNISAVADFCISQQKNVLVLCAGWKNKFNLEDSLFAGALVEQLVDKGNFDGAFDAAGVALGMWKQAKDDIWQYLQHGEHRVRLEKHGLLDVAAKCLTFDTMHILPKYDKQSRKIVL